MERRAFWFQGNGLLLRELPLQKPELLRLQPASGVLNHLAQTQNRAITTGFLCDRGDLGVDPRPDRPRRGSRRRT
jgi:hypothetical protein